MLCLKNEGAACRLSDFLVRSMGFGYAYAVSLIKKGDVKINGTRVKSDITINTNDQIAVYAEEKVPYIAYEDDNIAVFYKNSGIPSEGPSSFETRIKRIFGSNLCICHRLDANTEGLLVFSKHTEAYEAVLNAFKERKIVKRYVAAVHGRFENTGIYRAYLAKDADASVVRISNKRADGFKEIVTEIFEAETKGEISILRIKLHTGRTHQIRAHLLFLGFPVIGDEKYGKSCVNKKYGKKRQMLTAYGLTFSGMEGSFSYLNRQEITLPDNFLHNFYKL